MKFYTQNLKIPDTKFGASWVTSSRRWTLNLRIKIVLLRKIFAAQDIVSVSCKAFRRKCVCSEKKVLSYDLTQALLRRDIALLVSPLQSNCYLGIYTYLHLFFLN